MKENEIKELLEQVLANQAVIYKMLREIKYPGKSTPDAWIAKEFQEESEKIKNER